MTVSILFLFLTVPWFGHQCLIVAFPGHTHLFLVQDGSSAVVVNTEIIITGKILTFNIL